MLGAILTDLTAMATGLAVSGKPLLISQKAAPIGITPSIVCINPNYAANLGKIQRLASCYGIPQVFYTGDRIRIKEGARLPREERMKGFKDVQLIQYDRPLDQFKDATPVAIEVRENAESLFEFEHPDNPVYVFGPEDGFIPQAILQHCHRFVVVPVRHCMNLATCVSTILWDRELKLHLAGKVMKKITPISWENRGGQFAEADFE